MTKCSHKYSRLWITDKGPVRRCRDCGAIRKLTGVDKQQQKE